MVVIVVIASAVEVSLSPATLAALLVGFAAVLEDDDAFDLVDIVTFDNVDACLIDVGVEEVEDDE